MDRKSDNKDIRGEANIFTEMLSGSWYNAADPELQVGLRRCQQECYEINNIPPKNFQEVDNRIAKLFGKAGKKLHVNTPFHCDYGINVEVGDCFFANFNLTILDEAKVTFGDHVYIGPNCSFYTAIHPTDPVERNKDIERAAPIKVGDSVWFGGNVTVLPGVTIGSGTTIGAGSVVTKDIPANVVAAGNPCKVIKNLTPKA